VWVQSIDGDSVGFWNKIKQAFGAAKTDAERAAATAALKAAAASAVKAAENAADGFVTDAEARLADEENARSGRQDVRPDPSEADAIAADIERLVRDATKG
jgi:hypothetical protein